MKQINSWVKPEKTFIDEKYWVINGEYISHSKLAILLEEKKSPLRLSGIRSRVKRGLDLYEALTKPRVTAVVYKKQVREKAPAQQFTPESLVNTTSWT